MPIILVAFHLCRAVVLSPYDRRPRIQRKLTSPEEVHAYKRSSRELQEKLTPYRDEVRVLLDLEENKFAGLLKREDDAHKVPQEEGAAHSTGRGSHLAASTAYAPRPPRLQR